MAFRRCFSDTTEVTKTGLPKVLQAFKMYLLAQGTEPKRFFPFFRDTYNAVRDWRALLPLSFFRHCETFFHFFSLKGPQFTNTLTLWSPFAIFET